MNLTDCINQRLRYQLRGEVSPREGLCTELDATGTELRIEGNLVPRSLIEKLEIMLPEGLAQDVTAVVPELKEETPRERRRREHGKRQPPEMRPNEVTPEDEFQPKR